VYYHHAFSEQTLGLMRLYTEDPTRGTRRLCAVLRNDGIQIGRCKAKRLILFISAIANAMQAKRHSSSVTAGKHQC